MFTSNRSLRIFKNVIYHTKHIKTHHCNPSKYLITTSSYFHCPNNIINHPTNKYLFNHYRNIQQKAPQTHSNINSKNETNTEVTIQILEDTLSLIQYGEKKIFLIGTSHGSLKCAQKVREVIEEVQPQTIVLEICAERAKHLLSQIKKWKNHVRSGGKVTKFHRKQLLIGGEFRTALIEGQRIGAKIIYGDMDQHSLAEKFKFGLKKALQNPTLSLNDRLKLRAGCIAWSQWFGLKWNREKWIEKLKNRALMKQRLEYMNAKASVLQNGVMEERNDIIALAIRDCEGDLVVAVVGMDHMEGVEARFENGFVGVDLERHKISMDEMHADESVGRLKDLLPNDTWIVDDEFKEFRFARDLPQKTSKIF